MKKYRFTLLLLVLLLAFGCSDKKTAPEKTGDSQKPIAAPSLSNSKSPSLIEQEKPPAPAPKQISPSLRQHVSGARPHISGAPTRHISGIRNHISGQPRYSPSISGSQPHISGTTVRPHVSGQ